MTPRDHNKTLCLLHGLSGVLALAALLIVVAIELRETPPGYFFDPPPAARQANEWLSGVPARVQKELYFLPLPLLQLLAAYGLLKRRRWGRILALIFSALYVFFFPLGTLLAIYTYWFLHSAGARRLYAKDEGVA